MSDSRFSEHLLDEIRSRLPVSDVASRLVGNLKKDGAEFVALSPFQNEKTPSFKVNDRKRMWHDFSSGKGGDIFALECALTGCSFPEAVERLASSAGVDLPKSKTNGKANGHAYPPRPDAAPPAEERPGESIPFGGESAVPLSKKEARRQALRGEPVAVYDYKNAEGETLYQKLRFEWQWEGKRRKDFVQRRPYADGEWVWSLSEGEFYRASDGRWFTAPHDFDGPTVRLPAVQRVPYNLAAVLNAIETDDPVFICEGEKDANTLIAEGLCATCSVSVSWDKLGDYFSRADVIQLVDNDEAGEKYVQAAGNALAGRAKSHRVLRFRDLPPKADVTDFYEQHGGTTEALFERIARDAVPWSPTIPETEFSAIHFHQIGGKRPERSWQVKNLLLASAFGLVYGPPACGKSFLVSDLLLTLASAAVSPGKPAEWFGHRISRPVGAVYIASEAPEDFEIRLHAWRLRNEVAADAELPFVFLPTTIDMQSQAKATEQLIAEVKRIDVYFRVKFGVGVGVVAVDTVSRALAGGNENAPDVMGSFVRNCETLRRSIEGMSVIGVHHSPIDGSRPRGHSLLHGAADLEIEVRKADATRPNQWVVRKQKAGPEGTEHSFRLEPVVVGQDRDHEPITSCVVAGRMASDAARLAREKPRGQVRTRDHELEFLRALSAALERQGVAPPSSIEVPRNIEAVVESRYVREIYMEGVNLSEDGDSTAAVHARFRARWRRATKSMLRFNVIASASVERTTAAGETGAPAPTTYIWFTGRPFSGNVTIRGVRVTEPEKPVTEPGEARSSEAPDASQNPELSVTPEPDFPL